MGGMTCFGPVEPEENEPVFHGEWESRVLALSLATAGLFGSIDRRRHANEELSPREYLAYSYYEMWLARLERLSTEDGFLTGAEITSGVATPAEGPRETPIEPESMEAALLKGRPANRDSGRLQARYAVGDRVRARNLNPPGHTRLARYVRGRVGVIHRLHGTHCFPDTNAHGRGENPQPLYSICFEATELWGPSAPPRDRLFIDLWEDYLESADA